MAKSKHILNPKNEYRLGTRVYNPRRPHTRLSWERLVAIMEKNGGMLTGAQAEKALSYTPKQLEDAIEATDWRMAPVDEATGKQSNAGFRAKHQDFIGYMVANGYLVCKQAKS